MNNIANYISLMKNFGKCKFNKVLERTILNPDFHSPGTLIQKGISWGEPDCYCLKISSNNVLALKNWYDRRLYHLDHVEDGLIKPGCNWQYISNRINDIIRRYSNNKYIIQEIFSDRVGIQYPRPGTSNKLLQTKGKIFFYYLSNTDLSGYGKHEYKINMDCCRTLSESSALGNKNVNGEDFINGFGCPDIFFQNARDILIEAIKEIETIPDNLSFHIEDGQWEVLPTTKRLYSVWNEDCPHQLFTDQTVPDRQISRKLKEKIEEFKFHINNLSSPALEEDFQKFFESNLGFLLELGYDEIRSQISLIDESGYELRPDFFLRPIDKRLWEILEIKRPFVNLVVGRRNRERLSHEVKEGIAQLMNYSSFFDNPRNRDIVYKTTGIDCFKPRLTLVIGNKSNVEEELWNKTIQEERPLVNIIGFDEVLKKIERFSDIIDNMGLLSIG